jgi:tetratricopeptide (TPR) repeat protein
MSRRRARTPEPRAAEARAERLPYLWLLAGILGLTLVVYSRALAAGFIAFDDPDVVVNNPYIRELSGANAVRWFTRPVQYMYMPLALLSYALDHGIGALDPFVYHLHNLVLHLACVALAFRVFLLLDGKPRDALVVCVLFAVHPVNVDSVASIAARTNLLATLFSLGALAAYGLYLDRGRRLRYLALAWGSFVLAALAKSSAVVLPLTLLLWDWYRRRRWEPRLALEKLPFFAVALFFGVLALVMRADDVLPPVRYGAWDRVLVFVYALARYVVRLVVPFPLSFDYAYPEKDGPWLPLPFYLAPIVLAAIVWGLRRLRVPREVWIFGLAFFVLNVALSQSVLLIDGFTANRYAYLPYLGLFFVLAQLLERAWSAALPEGRARRTLRGAAGAALGVAVLAFSALAFGRTAVWRDTLALLDDVVEKGQGSAWVYGTRGLVKLHAGDLASALRDLDRSLELDPNYTPGLCYRGAVHYLLREYPAALADLDRAIALAPATSGAYRDRGKVKLALHDEEGALADLDRALALDPGSEARALRDVLRRDRGAAR